MGRDDKLARVLIRSSSAWHALLRVARIGSGTAPPGRASALTV